MEDTYQLFELIRTLSDRVLTLELQLSIVTVQLDDHRRLHHRVVGLPSLLEDPPPDYHDDGLD